MTRSALDDVPGLGPTRAAALLAHFGTVAALRAASVEDLTEVPGIGATTAESVLATLTAQ